MDHLATLKRRFGSPILPKNKIMFPKTIGLRFRGPFLQIGQRISVKPLLQSFELGNAVRNSDPDHKTSMLFTG